VMIDAAGNKSHERALGDQTRADPQWLLKQGRKEGNWLVTQIEVRQ
jgi:hypothetical protein